MHLTLYRGISPSVVDACDFEDWPELVATVKDLVSRTYSRTYDEHGVDTTKLGMLAIAPHRLRPGARTRNTQAIASVTLIAIDVDACNVDRVGNAIDALGVEAMMYASPSDDPAQPEARRVRVLVPTNREMTIEECGPARLALAAALGLDPACGVAACLDASRLYFAGCVEGMPPREVWEWYR